MTKTHTDHGFGFRKLTSLGFLFSVLTLSSGCSPGLGALNSYVQSQGYIPFTSPVANAGPGTIIGGTPAELTFVTPPQTCFPDTLANGTATNLRDVFPTSLPSESSSIKGTGALSVQLSNLVTQLTGVANFQGSASFNSLKEVDLNVGNAQIEAMDLVALENYYQNSMTAECKQYLNVAGFVLQALRVDSLTFTFLDSNGAAIDLTGSFAGSVSGHVGGSYQLSNKTTLVITSPTYIGYQLGSLRNGSQGFTLYRAADVSNGNFDFQTLSVFPGSGPDGTGATADAPTLPNGQVVPGIDKSSNYPK